MERGDMRSERKGEKGRENSNWRTLKMGNKEGKERKEEEGRE